MNDGMSWQVMIPLDARRTRLRKMWLQHDEKSFWHSTYTLLSDGGGFWFVRIFGRACVRLCVFLGGLRELRFNCVLHLMFRVHKFLRIPVGNNQNKAHFRRWAGKEGGIRSSLLRVFLVVSVIVSVDQPRYHASGYGQALCGRKL